MSCLISMVWSMYMKQLVSIGEMIPSVSPIAVGWLIGF